MPAIKHSIVARISAYMLTVYLMALISILASFIVADRTRGDAAALNIAGSLRMQTYRIINTLHELSFNEQPERALMSEQLQRTLDGFSERLELDDLTNAIPKATDQRLNTQYLQIRSIWHEQLLPRLSGLEQLSTAQFMEYEQDLEAMFQEIDQMVSLLEHNTETKIRLLLFIQFTCLAFAIAMILISVEDIRKKIVKPLKRLMLLVNEAGNHNFNIRSELHGEDELSALGHTFDDMAAQLSASYANLEGRVKKKTLELERSHRALQLLHDANHSLYDNGGDLCRGAIPVLKELEKLLEIGPTNLYLNDSEVQNSLPVMSTQVVTRPAYCKDYSCNACLADDSASDEAPKAAALDQLVLPVTAGNKELGTLEISYPKGRVLSERALRLLETLADQLGTAIYLHNKMSEQQQLSLLEERTVIARELHDSLAQSLSYLKIQVSRLQKLQQKESTTERQTTVVGEMRTGLNSAYRQLRELLTTFRLQLDKPGLHEAFKQTVAEFSERLGFPVDLHYDLPPNILNPNEEVHVLQVAREALSNAQKHAQASHIEVSIFFKEACMHLSVRDNGIGLTDGKIPDEHYGLIIMRDRSMTLGGNLSIANHSEGGVEVHLTFSPASGPSRIKPFFSSRATDIT